MVKPSATSEALEGFLHAGGGDRLRFQESGGGDADTAATDRDDSAAAADGQNDTKRHCNVSPSGTKSGMTDGNLSKITIVGHFWLP